MAPFWAPTVFYKDSLAVSSAVKVPKHISNCSIAYDHPNQSIPCETNTDHQAKDDACDSQR